MLLMDDSQPVLDVVVTSLVLLAIVFLIVRARRLPRGLRLPPGPPRRLIVENIPDFPTHHEWETFTRWSKEYGPIVSLKILRQPVIIISSLEAVTELLEKRSSIYSDRLDFPMLNDLMGFDWNFVIMHYGEKWRRHRKMFQREFHPAAATGYHAVQISHVRHLLRKFHASPDDFLQHIRHLSGAIIVEVIYGIKVLPVGDPYIEIAEQAFAVGGIAAVPGKFLVDMLPMLKYVPEWVPGAGFKRKARIWKETVRKMPTVPFATVKRALKEGTARPSFTATLLERLATRTDKPEDEEEIIRNTGATAYGAGADTVTNTLSWLMVVLILYPDVQRKAQAELDSVVAADRFPTFDDREKLPYIDALCKELYRWRPVFPIGAPRRLMQDDVYEDMFFPMGSTVIVNTWGVLHDEKVYGPRPEEFNPERFFLPGINDATPAFGYGRRLCPGRHMADNTVFMAVASILKVFNVSLPKDQNGNEIPVNISFTSGAILRPEPFKCQITLRSKAAERLLEYGDDES